MLSELQLVISPFCEPLQKGRADRHHPGRLQDEEDQDHGKQLGKPFRHQKHLPGGVSQSNNLLQSPSASLLLVKMELLQKAFLSKVLSDVLIFPYMNPCVCFNKGCTGGSRTHSAGDKNQHITEEE